MAKEKIKDKRGCTLGSVETFLNGTAKVYDNKNIRIGELKPQGKQIIAYSKTAQKIAYWDESRNITFDKMGRKIGNGNLLLEIFFQEDK